MGHDDPHLGPLRWDGWAWISTRHFGNGLTVAIELDMDLTADSPVGPDLPPPRAREAAEFLTWLETHEWEMRGRVADAMFPGWLEGWRDPEIDQTCTLVGFRRKLRLAVVSFYPGGNVGLVYSDGGLFGGHGISATVDMRGGFIHTPNIFG